MPGHVSNYAITTTPTTSTGGGGEAPDKSVLYWDAVNNLIKGDAKLIYDDTTGSIRIYKTGGTEYGLFTWLADEFTVGTSGSPSRNLVLGGRFVESAATFRPTTDATNGLGASTLRWSDSYFGGVSARVPITVKAHASQTANLQEWQDSSGTALSIITPKGNAGLGTTSPVTRLTVKAGTAAPEAVVWENLTNATVVGDTMTCTSSATGGGNGQQISLAGGYVEHTWNGNAAADNCMVGFATFSGRGNYNAAGTFYIYTYDTTDGVLVYENGAYVTGFLGLTAGDVLRVERTAANQIKYYQNGVLKYTSVATIPQSTFYVSSQILTSGGKIKAAMVSSNAVNIQEWRDSSAILVSRVDQSGDFFIKGLTASVVAKTTTYTVVDTDHVVKCDAGGGAWTVTLPPAGANTGRLIHIKKTDSSANRITIDGNASELVEDATTQQLIYQGENLMLQCDGTQWWVL